MTRRALQNLVLSAALAAVAAALAGCASSGVTAAVHRDPARLQRILDQPNHGGEDLGNVLSNAIAFDCAECVRVLLGAGAKPGADSLVSAALSGRERIAKLLVGAGAAPDAAIEAIHAQTRAWVGGSGLSAQQSQAANDLLKKIERERAAEAEAQAPAAPAMPAASAPAAAPPRTPSAPVVPAFHEEKKADDYAIVVGLENYDGLPAAEYAESDARTAAEFVKALGVPSGNLVTLTGARATRSGVAKYLEGWLPENVAEDSTVYFYFAGLGAADPKSGRTYLVPFDGDPRYLEQTSYPLKRLYETLDGLKAKRAIVVLDTGFSGTGARSAAAPGAKPAAGRVDAGFNAANGKVALLAAADGNQTSGADAKNGCGLLACALWSGLNGAAQDASGRVTLKSLSDYVKTKVRDDARRAGRVQLPLFESGGTATDGVILRGN